MMDKLIYYYRVIHLQVGSTAIVALALVATVVAVVALYLFKAETDKGSTQLIDRRIILIQVALWVLLISPVGLVVVYLINFGQTNEPVYFAIIPAVVCVAYTVSILWDRVGKVWVLIAAFIIALIAVSQVSGISKPPVTTDAYGREGEIRDLEGFISESDDVIMAPYAVAGRLCEYHDDMKVYIYEDYAQGDGQQYASEGAIDMDADVIICPIEDTTDNWQIYMYGFTELGRTEHYAAFRL